MSYSLKLTIFKKPICNEHSCKILYLSFSPLIVQDLSEEERAAAASASGQQEEEEKGSREESQGKDSHAQSTALDPPHTLATLHLANAGKYKHWIVEAVCFLIQY